MYYLILKYKHLSINKNYNNNENISSIINDDTNIYQDSYMDLDEADKSCISSPNKNFNKNADNSNSKKITTDNNPFLKASNPFSKVS